MKKIKLFLENFLIYGLGGVISKVIPLIMVPITTRLMPNASYFGISDLSNTVIQFGSAIAIMGMYDAMYRMFFEREELQYKKTVCSTALIFTCATSFVVFLVMLAAKDLIATYFFRNRQYAYVVYLSAMAMLVGATNSIISAPTRMENKGKIFLITNAVSPILSYCISIPLLLAGYYVIALPVAAVISGLAMEITFGILNRKWFSFRQFDAELLKEMFVIAIPLLPNFLIYWLFNSCDKLMIANMIGIEAEGVYSVGAKLGQASQMIYLAFAGGWQYFSFSLMKENDQVKTNSLVFEYLGIISFVSTAFICAWSFAITDFLFTNIYLEAYIVSPYLFLAPLLQMLFQVAVNQFLIIKKTWPNMFILFAGAAVNVMLNNMLIPVLGIEGAAIATLMGYAISDIVCVIVLCKMKLMVISCRFLISCGIAAGSFLVWRLFCSSNTIMGTVYAMAMSAMFAFLYRKELQIIAGGIKGFVTKKNK